MIATSRQNRTNPNLKKAENRIDESLIYELAHILRAEPQHDGQYHADCPFCGKEAKRGQTHFTFGEKGYYCFPCGAGGGLKALAKHLELDPQPTTHHENVARPHFAKKPTVTPLSERVDLAALVDEYHSRPIAYQSWLKYMPYLSHETFDAYHLGEGCLPARQKGQWQKTNRLVLPIIDGGEIVGLRGRLLPNTPPSKAPKWIFAAGGKTPFFNTDSNGDLIVLCENNTNSIGIQQQHPTIDGAKLVSTSPTTGVKTRLPGKVLEACRDKVVVIWTDNDPAGRHGGALWRQQLELITKSVITFQWAIDDPPKADLGDLLIADYEQGTNRVGDFLQLAVRSEQPTLDDYQNSFPTSGIYHFGGGIPAAYLELLLSQEKAITGDLGKGAAVEYIIHLALIGGEIEPDILITRGLIETISELIGHKLTRRTIDDGLQILADLGRLTHVQNCTHIIKDITKGCKNVHAYQLQPLAVAFEQMRRILEYQILASYHDWLPSIDPENDAYGYQVLAEFERLNIADVVNPDDIDRQIERLEKLTVEGLERGRAFVCPDGFTITNSKSLRIAYTRYLYEWEGLNGDWQIGIYSLSKRLGVSENTASTYRREAGLNTREVFSDHNLDKAMPLEPQIMGLTRGRMGGVRLYIGEFEHHYLHDGNRKQVLSRAMECNKAISLVIQQPSIAYDATPEEIEETARKRSERLQKAIERKQRDNEQLGQVDDECETPTPDYGETPDSEAPQPELKEGYSRAYIYYHLKLLLDQLLEVVDQSPVIEELLINYGLYTPRSLEKHTFNEGSENAVSFQGLREHWETVM